MHTLDYSLLYHAAACLWSRLRETSAVYIIAWIIEYELSLFLHASLVSFIRDDLELIAVDQEKQSLQMLVCHGVALFYLEHRMI